jgi:hypothetical protein
MKNILLSILIILFSFSLLWGDAEILEFRAEPEQNQITVTWKTGQEINVNIFQVEKSTNNKDFTLLAEVEPRGNNSEYKIEDDTISRTRSIYYYRLKIINSNGSIQTSESLPVIPNISSIKKTWGSIKALFR